MCKEDASAGNQCSLRQETGGGGSSGFVAKRLLLFLVEVLSLLLFNEQVFVVCSDQRLVELAVCRRAQ